MQRIQEENQYPNSLIVSQHFINKQRRQQKTQNKSKLMRLKFMVPEVSSNWRQLTKGVLSQKISSLTDTGDKFKLLFSISQDVFWRNKVYHIQILIQQIHNNLIQQSSVAIYHKIPDFEEKIQFLCCLKNKNVAANMTLLMEILIVINRNQGYLNDHFLSLAVLDLMGQHQINTKVIWMLTILQNVHSDCIKRLLKKELYKGNELPFLSILANFMINCSTQDALFVVQNQSFMNLINQIFNDSCDLPLHKRQAHLLLNNILGKRGEPFCKLTSHQSLVQILLRQQTQETWWTLLILFQISKETGNCFIQSQQCLSIAGNLQKIIFNEKIRDRLNNIAVS